MLIGITIVRCTVERPNPRPFKSVYLQSLHYFNQGFWRIRFVYNVHNRILLSKGETSPAPRPWRRWHMGQCSRTRVSILSLKFIPLLTPVRFPMHHYVDGPISVIYFDNEALI